MARSRRKSGGGGSPNKKLPLKQSIPLGIQHVFAMFAGNITVPLIVAGVFGVTTSEKIFLIQMVSLLKLNVLHKTFVILSSLMNL